MSTPIRDDGGNPPPHPPKLSASRPGYQTTEFWLTVLATILGAIMATGFFSQDSVYAQIIGATLALLAHLGYNTARAVTKSSEAKAMASAADSVARERAVKAFQDPTKRSRSTE